MDSKVCTGCGEAKPRAAFYRDKYKPDGRTTQCADCIREPSRLRMRELRSDPVKRERQRASNRASYARHRDRWPTYRKRWQERNRAQQLAIWIAKNLRRKAAPLTEAAHDYVTVLLADPCSYCGNCSAGTIDHITPLAAGGDSDWPNLTAACRSCNSRKHDRPLLEAMVHGSHA